MACSASCECTIPEQTDAGYVFWGKGGRVEATGLKGKREREGERKYGQAGGYEKAKGKGYERGKGDGKGWQGKGNTAGKAWGPTPNEPEKAATEEKTQLPWICLACITSHDNPNVTRCRICRLKKERVPRVEANGKREQEMKAKATKETALHNKYLSLQGGDGDGEAEVGNEEMLKYDEEKKYHEEAVVRANEKGRM